MCFFLFSLLWSILPWLLLRISFSFQWHIGVQAIFTCGGVCSLGKNVTKQSFVCGKENCFGCLFYFFFLLYGGNGIAYDSSNMPRVSLGRNAGGGTYRESNDNTNKTNKIDLRNCNRGKDNRATKGGKVMNRKEVDWYVK